MVRDFLKPGRRCSSQVPPTTCREHVAIAALAHHEHCTVSRSAEREQELLCAIGHLALLGP